MSEKDKNDGEASEEDEFAKFKNLTPVMREEIDECFSIFAAKSGNDTVDYYSMGQLLRWLKFNPTDKELKSYADKYDPSKTMEISKKSIYEIVDQKMLEPDTIEELIKAMEILDTNRDGTIPTNELRYCMTKLGDPIPEDQVDEMIKEIDGEKGFVTIIEFAKICFNIKEKKGKD